jgi:dTDP-4-dehydrorhamnose reductase
MTNVDGCEDSPDLAWQINAEGPRALARVARETGAALLHVSTDYVFPGDDAHPGPYGEGDAVRPVSAYGRSKLGGEQAIAEELGANHPWLIARTAIVIGTGPNQRPNFVTWLARELHAGRRVKIVNDQYNTPTLSEDLARALLWNAAAGTTGVYHATGPTYLGRHEWALAIADHFHLSRDLIDWVTSAELKQKAQRPLRSGLRCERLTADQARGAPTFLGAVECLDAIDWGLDF